MRAALVALLLGVALPAQDPGPAAAGFGYRTGEVLVAVEHTLQRETDARLGYALTSSHTTERRYTVLAVDQDGNADVLVEESSGPQQLHEYLVRDQDEREAYRKKGFDAKATERRRVLLARMTRTRFRTEPARDEPAVYYLQELPELLAHALTLPADGATAWTVAPPLPRLQARLALRQVVDGFDGEVQLAITDPRVRDGAALPCPTGSVRCVLDAEHRRPRSWRVELRYPRLPVDRPNTQVVTGELHASAPLAAGALEQLRADFAAFAAVRDGFFAGRFPEALRLAEAFVGERAGSRLLPAVQAEVAAFHRQVPRYGEAMPEPLAAHWFGGAPVTLAALRGKVVVLDFWATWCVPCVAGMGHLMTAQQQHSGDGLQVLGFTRLDARQTLDAVRAFHATGYAAGHDGRQPCYPWAVLGDDRTHDWCGVRAIPVLVVLDRDGKVCWQQTGGGNEARLDRVLAAALAR